MTDLKQITDVYGDMHFVRAADLAGKKTLLPMFKSNRPAKAQSTLG